MRHKKNTVKLNRTTSHRRCLFANMLKSLIYHGRIKTTVAKAKALKPHADRMVTLAKQNSLASKRRANAALMIRHNTLTPKEARKAKEGNLSYHNEDRQVMGILFEKLGPRFSQRQGGYTRIIRYKNRVGDNAETCILEFLEE